MDIVLEFFKSLVVPKKMAKYRYMSVLISIIIFLLILQVVVLPFSYTNSKTFKEKREQYNYQALLEIEPSLAEVSDVSEENLVKLQKLAALECEVTDSKLSCSKLAEAAVLSDADYHEQILINASGITKKIDIVVFAYKEAATEEDLTKVQENANKIITDFNKLEYVENEENFLLILLAERLYYQAHPQTIIGQNLKHNDNLLIPGADTYDYNTFVASLNLKVDSETSKSIGGLIVDVLSQAQILAENSMIGAQLFFTFFLPAILFIFLFWLIFRKNGKLTTFKEYFNLAAISSILVTVLVFIIGWFWSQVFGYYLFAFMGFYLFVLYKINSAPNDVN